MIKRILAYIGWAIKSLLDDSDERIAIIQERHSRYDKELLKCIRNT